MFHITSVRGKQILTLYKVPVRGGYGAARARIRRERSFRRITVRKDKVDYVLIAVLGSFPYDRLDRISGLNSFCLKMYVRFSAQITAQTRRQNPCSKIYDRLVHIHRAPKSGNGILPVENRCNSQVNVHDRLTPFLFVLKNLN